MQAVLDEWVSGFAVHLPRTAVDRLRRRERKALNELGDDSLKDSRLLWLTNPDDLDATVAMMRASGRFEQVAVLVRLEQRSAWLRDALRSDWQFGALLDVSCLITHHESPEALPAVMHRGGRCGLEGAIVGT
jgi:hypothetical protein